MSTPRPAITAFEGPYRFLSNTWPQPIVVDGIQYPTTEHAYQAAKASSHTEKRLIREAASPARAKRLGRTVTIRPDWETVKTQIMYEIVRVKFEQPLLRESLLATGNAHLEEANSWGDRYWGTTDGKGRNELGKILMRVRNEIAKSP